MDILKRTIVVMVSIMVVIVNDRCVSPKIIALIIMMLVMIIVMIIIIIMMIIKITIEIKQ